MQSIEVTAKSMDEAKRIAAEKLGVGVDQIEATVLEETKGLFGKTTLRVGASVTQTTQAAAVEKPSAAQKEPASRGRRTAAKPPLQEVQEAVEAPAPEAVHAEPAPAEASQPRRGGRGRGPARTAEPKEGDSTQDQEREGQSRDNEPEIVATQADADRLADLLRGLIASADLTVDVKPGGLNGRYVNIQLDGKDAAFLVGKHGEVLNALQYLVNIIGSRKIANGVRVTLDGNDYRKRREDTLTALAINIAEEVKKRREEAVLDALPAFERRIVHKALSTVTGITTYSEGEEPNRRVVVAPAER